MKSLYEVMVQGRLHVPRPGPAVLQFIAKGVSGYLNFTLHGDDQVGRTDRV